MTRVLISDDHPLIRRGLRTILEASGRYQVCGEAGDGNETLQLAAQLVPDVLVLDISMPAPNGLEVAARLRQALPDIKILMITMYESVEALSAAAAAGASGYLLKSDVEEQLMVALNCLAEGKSYLSPAFNPELAKQFLI